VEKQKGKKGRTNRGRDHVESKQVTMENIREDGGQKKTRNPTGGA